MDAPEFRDFRLVGGTALSFHRGHRESADIDMFTDIPYGSVDFIAIDNFLHSTFSYVDTKEINIIGPGKSYFTGDSQNESVKLDLFYTDPFIQEFVLIDGIRIATVEEIIAMKMDVILRGGRKKDFWDIHELIDEYPIERMMALHKQRYPYNHDPLKIRNCLSDFEIADEDFDPICLKGKYWELIKLDLIDFAER